jgi:hypothetical protein
LILVIFFKKINLIIYFIKIKPNKK